MYPDATAVIDALATGIRATLGEELIGLYLYGSLVFGDFDPDVSDLDLTAILEHDPTEADLPPLRTMHDEIAASFPHWSGRIEVQYISRDALRTFREQRKWMVNISPGEPIHMRDTGIDWLINWYLITHHGVTIAGPDPRTVIPPISHTEFVASARDQAQAWMDRIDDIADSQSQSYATLTLSRALYTHRTGEHVSKANAAAWVARELPEWAPMLQNALDWRRRPSFESPATISDARRFVRKIVDIIVSESPT